MLGLETEEGGTPSVDTPPSSIVGIVGFVEDLQQTTVDMYSHTFLSYLLSRAILVAFFFLAFRDEAKRRAL